MSNNFVHPWYVVRVKPRFEKWVTLHLQGKGYEVYLPLYRQRKRRSGGYRSVELPLFPQYVFCRFDSRRRLPILQTPGVHQVVASGGRLLPVEEGQVEAVRQVAESKLSAEPWPCLREGQRVWIHDGPLRNVEGILADVKDHCRLVVNVTLLQRAVAVEIDRDWASPVPA